MKQAVLFYQMKYLCSLLGPLVQHTVRQYMNLNNAEQLLKWVGETIYSDTYRYKSALVSITQLIENCETKIS